MECLETILTRRSIRKYTDAPISEEQLHKLLHAGMSAPSAMGGRPYEFLVIKDKDMLAKIADGIGPWKALNGAAACIVVLANLEGAPKASQDLYMLDCSAAAQNILLAAHALGLSGVWLGTYLRADREARIQELFQLPSQVKPVVTLALGYPAEVKQDVLPYDSSKVHSEKY